jgi:hypothetical protein
MNEERDGITRKLIVYKGRMECNKPSPFMSQCLLKTISKLARCLVKESILMVVETEKSISQQVSDE